LVEVVNDEPRHHLDHQRGQDPRQPHQSHLAWRTALQLGGIGAGDAKDVLGGFLSEDVDDIVHGDGAEEPVLSVHHRDADEVVLGDDPRHLLAVRLRCHAHDVLVADGQDSGLGIGNQKRRRGTTPIRWRWSSTT
jgi:hypothetical protein